MGVLDHTQDVDLACLSLDKFHKVGNALQTAQVQHAPLNIATVNIRIKLSHFLVYLFDTGFRPGGAEHSGSWTGKEPDGFEPYPSAVVVMTVSLVPNHDVFQWAKPYLAPVTTATFPDRSGMSTNGFHCFTMASGL